MAAAGSARDLAVYLARQQDDDPHAARGRFDQRLRHDIVGHKVRVCDDDGFFG